MRSVAQTSARLKEAAKLGFGRAVLPESARGDAGDAGLSLTTVSGLTSLVADIAALGTPRKGADKNSRVASGKTNQNDGNGDTAAAPNAGR